MLRTGTAVAHTNKMVASLTTYLDFRQEGTFSMVARCIATDDTTNNYRCIGGKGSGVVMLLSNTDAGSPKRRVYLYLNGVTNVGNAAGSTYTVGTDCHIAWTVSEVGTTVRVKFYFNGVLIENAVVTKPSAGSAWQWGEAPGAWVPDAWSLAEQEWSTTVLTDAQITSLYNSGVFKRQRDLGITVVNYHHLFTSDASTAIADSATGGVSLTLTGISVPTNTFITHPVMSEPIAEFDAASGLYDATSGGSACADGTAVARWEDQSGRKLHLTESTLADRPVYRNGANDPFPSVFFNKFPSTSSPDTESTAKLSIASVRFNTASMTVAAVFDTVSFANEYNSANVNADRTFKTLWCNDNASGGRVLLSREVAGVAGVWSSGVVRSEGVNLDSGGGQSTPSAYAFIPCTPSLLIYCSDSTKTQKQGVAINDFSADNIRTSTTTLASVGTAGAFHLGHNPNASGGLAAHNHWGGFYKLKIWNRPVATLGAGAGSLTPGSTLEALRDAYDASGLITKTPTALVLVDGSSSAEGLAASDGRNLSYLLWARSGRYRRSWIFNIGSRVALVGGDTTSGSRNIPSRDNHAADTWDIIAARFPTVPRHTFFWGGLNDINGTTGSDSGSTASAADLLADVETYLTNRQTAQGGDDLGSAMWPISAVLALWKNDLTDGDEDDRIDAYNALLDSDDSRGVFWNKIVRLDQTALADIAAVAADAYTDDNRHPNPTGFLTIFNRVKIDALHPGGGRRTRARSRCRATSPSDYTSQ